MSTVDVLHKLSDPGGTVGAMRTVTVELIASSRWTADKISSVIGTRMFAADEVTGLVTMNLLPQSQIAQPNTYYRATLSRSGTVYYFVVPNAGPVQLVDCLVDPTTLNPVSPVLQSLYQPTAQKGLANGYAGLDVNGKVPAAQLPAASGGSSVDSVNGKTGVVVLTAADVGAYVKPGGGIPSTDMTAGIQTALSAATTAVQPAALTSTANARGLQAATRKGPFIATFGPCGVTGTTWSVCPVAFRSDPITASAGDTLDWLPSFILGAVTASADAEFDLATIDNTNTAAPVTLRCLSSGNATPLDNGEGGMYCWQNNSRRVPAVVDWLVTSTDIVGGTVTFALLYKAAGSGLSIGHGSVYGSRITVRNWGKVPS